MVKLITIRYYYKGGCVGCTKGGGGGLRSVFIQIRKLWSEIVSVTVLFIVCILNWPSIALFRVSELFRKRLPFLGKPNDLYWFSFDQVMRLMVFTSLCFFYASIALHGYCGSPGRYFLGLVLNFSGSAGAWCIQQCFFLTVLHQKIKEESCWPWTMLTFV